MTEDAKIPRRITIAALWLAVTLCYAYGDIIAFYEPGAVQRLLDGRMGFWEVTPELMAGIAVFMSVPPILAVLTLVLPPPASRWINIIGGLLFSGVMLVTMINAFKFGLVYYLYLGIVEIAMTAMIVVLAARWPRKTF